jgi:hypothetical protein
MVRGPLGNEWLERKHVAMPARSCLKSPSNRRPRMLLVGVQGVCKNLDSRQKLAGMTIRGIRGNDDPGQMRE